MVVLGGVALFLSEVPLYDLEYSPKTSPPNASSFVASPTPSLHAGPGPCEVRVLDGPASGEKGSKGP